MKLRENLVLQQALVIGLGLLVILGLFWVNFQFAGNNPGGNDFLVHYVGTRAFIYEGISPYSEEVALRIQNAAYGHAAQGIEHELRVAYPLYSIILFAPFSVIENYQLARAVWMTVLEIALIAMCFLSFRLVDWRPSLLIQGLTLLFSLLWYHAIRGVINGNAVILIALLITLIFYLIKIENDRAAGILLAFTTIKPHLVVLLILYIFLFAIHKKRWNILLWFTGTMLLLFGFGWLLIPDWILQNIWEILRYPEYNPAGTLAEAVGEWLPGIARELKWGIGTILGLLTVFEWTQLKMGGFRRFLWTGMLTLTISQWIGIQTDPGNFIMLYPVLILVIAVLSQRWVGRELWITGSILGALLIGLWIIFIATVQQSYQPVQSSVMFIPVPALGLVGLYWIKWWVVGAHTPLWKPEI